MLLDRVRFKRIFEDAREEELKNLWDRVLFWCPYGHHFPQNLGINLFLQISQIGVLLLFNGSVYLFVVGFSSAS